MKLFSNFAKSLGLKQRMTFTFKLLVAHSILLTAISDARSSHGVVFDHFDDLIIMKTPTQTKNLVVIISFQRHFKH